MKTLTLAICLLAHVVASAQWSNSANNYTTGRLSVGTSTTELYLHVSATEPANHIAFLYNASPTGYGTVLRSATYPLRVKPFSGTGDDLFTVDGTGKVGVNTTNPTSAFQVNGDTKIGMDAGLTSGYGNALYFIGNGTNGDHLYIQRYNNGANKSELRVNIGDDYGQAEDKFVVGTNYWSNGQWYPHLVVQANGRVGIGSSNPDEKLTVNGKIHATEIKVDLSVPGPDYVFAKDYKLPSIAQLKKYIDDNQHLPEVPSAKEMQENGINVSEMNMILLKKIEELTLYVIKLQSEVDDLKSKK